MLIIGLVRWEFAPTADHPPHPSAAAAAAAAAAPPRDSPLLRARRPPAGRLPPSLPPQRISFSTGVSALQICRPSVRLSLCSSVRPSVRPCRSTVRRYVRIYVRTYTYVPARHFRAEYKRAYVYVRVSPPTYADMYKCASGTGTYGHYLPTYYYV